MYSDTPATENAERHAIKLTKRHLVRLFWVLTVPFLFPSALAAEPSLAETVQYIEAKLVAHNEHLANYKAKSFRLNGQTVTCIREDKYNKIEGFSPEDIEELTFKLGDLSTGVVVAAGNYPGGLRVNASCARGACISMHIYDGEVRGNRRESGIKFEVDPDDAKRVQKALIHAIKISGGKEELF